MWPFLKKHKASPKEDAPARRPLGFSKLLDGMGDFQDLGHHDTALKFWLPEPARQALQELAERQGESMSELLRQFLAQHTYGLYAFHLMNDRYPGLFKVGLPQPHEGIRFSRRHGHEEDGKKRIDTYWVPELGKNVMSIKLWLPKRLRDDLQVLADHTGIRLSQYVREIVISRLLGHGTLPKRAQMLTAQPLASAQAWEAGETIAMRQVSAEEYCKHGDGQVHTEWVSDDCNPS
jgi:predicted DNA-binding protein